MNATSAVAVDGKPKLLDRFHNKMRSLHYALSTEKSYRHWIVEFLRCHRVSGKCRHPAELGKPEVESCAVSGDEFARSGLTDLSQKLDPAKPTEHIATSMPKRRRLTCIGVHDRSGKPLCTR